MPFHKRLAERRANLDAPIKRPYRIAVCLSGQARTWRSCVEAIKSFFAISHHELDVTVDYFIHTWDANTWTRGGDSTPIPASDFDDLRAAYEPVEMSVSPIRTRNFRGWDGLFYSFMRTIHMKKNHELANGFEYDLVVKSRLDTVFNPGVTMPIHDLETLIGYTCLDVSKFEQEFFGNDFHDVFFYGDSPTMDIIGDLVWVYCQTCNEDRWARDQVSMIDDGCINVGPGVLLWRHLVDANIHPVCKAFLPYTIVRQQAEKLGLDPIKDFPAVHEIYRGGYPF